MNTDTKEATSTDLRGSLGRSVDRASSGAHEKLDQLSDAAGPAVDRIASSAHGVIDTVADAAVGAVETLGIKGDQLNNAQEKLTEAARTYMREKPVASLGIAVAAGWILSRLLR
jgi:ElaB/YqjD/DUF883 family membrane-anchored ribosome-binding protein